MVLVSALSLSLVVAVVLAKAVAVAVVLAASAVVLMSALSLSSYTLYTRARASETAGRVGSGKPELRRRLLRRHPGWCLGVPPAAERVEASAAQHPAWRWERVPG